MLQKFGDFTLDFKKGSIQKCKNKKKSLIILTEHWIALQVLSFLQYIEDKAPARIQLKQQQNFTVNMCDATKRLAHISPGTLSATASLSYNVSLFAMS